MSFETILNLIWLSVSALLLILLEIADVRRGSRAAGFCHSKRLVVIFLAALFIFPCISASDDIWSFQNLQAIPESRRLFQSRLGETNESPTWRLAHFFESLQTLTLSRAFTLSSLYCFLGLIYSPSGSTSRRSILPGFGRAPPSFASHA